MLEDIFNRDPRLLLNHNVTVEPRPSQPLRQSGSDAGFSTGSITNQCDNHVAPIKNSDAKATLLLIHPGTTDLFGLYAVQLVVPASGSIRLET
jgi:hypothetical protein